MAHIDITNLPLDSVPPADQVATIRYRLETDPDDPASYILVSNSVVVAPDGHLPTPVTIPGLLASTGYVVWATNNCGGAGFKKLFVTLGPTCPAGYTLSPDGTYCYREDIEPAENTGGGSPYTVCRSTNVVYSSFETRIMKVSGYDSATGVPLAGAGNIPTDLVVAPFWWNTPPGNLTDGPLNRLGIWACGPGGIPCTTDCPPVDTPIGFSRQFMVPVSGVYYIGLGADNYMTATIQDGISGTRLIVEEDADAIGAYFGLTNDITFKSFLIYPFFLNAGPNIITITGVNTSASPAVLGAEVYNNTEAEIVASTSIADLDIIFSTDVDQSFVSAGEEFDTGNWNCDAHPGYSLRYDPGSNTYSCVLIETVPPIS